MSERGAAELESTVQAAVQAATRGRVSQWAGLRVELPFCDSLAAFESLESTDRFYFERPSVGQALVGDGCVAMIETNGAARFEDSAEQAKQLFAAIHVAGEAAAPEAGPFLVGGFAFSNAPSSAAYWNDFPGGRLVLPEATVSTVEGRTWLTVLQRVEPGDGAREICERLRSNLAQREAHFTTAGAADAPRALPAGENKAPTCQAVADRSHADYRAQVSAALQSIADGVFEKVVLARSVCLRREGGFEPCEVLNTLRRIHPGCAIFAVGRGSSLFFGATPECLVRLHDRRIETASVAGSAPRGRNPEEDLQLGRDLLECKKEQAEHAVVVRALRAVLSPHCEDLEIPESPRMMQLQDIQHLETPITGTVRGDTSILDLLGTVHPTPAIAGEPREAALEWLADHECLDRGWYGGPVGFADATGGGCFFAALRSSVVVGDQAQLFAGAGIVEGSQPERELCETRLKLRTMLAPLFEI